MILRKLENVWTAPISNLFWPAGARPPSHRGRMGGASRLAGKLLGLPIRVNHPCSLARAPAGHFGPSSRQPRTLDISTSYHKQQQKQEKKQKVEFQSKIVTEDSQTLYK